MDPDRTVAVPQLHAVPADHAAAGVRQNRGWPLRGRWPLNESEVVRPVMPRRLRVAARILISERVMLRLGHCRCTPHARTQEARTNGARTHGTRTHGARTHAHTHGARTHGARPRSARNLHHDVQRSALFMCSLVAPSHLSSASLLARVCAALAARHAPLA